MYGDSDLLESSLAHHAYGCDLPRTHWTGLAPAKAPKPSQPTVKPELLVTRENYYKLKRPVPPPAYQPHMALDQESYNNLLAMYNCVHAAPTLTFDRKQSAWFEVDSNSLHCVKTGADVITGGLYQPTTSPLGSINEYEFMKGPQCNSYAALLRHVTPSTRPTQLR